MADQNINNMTVTWNSGGTTFSAVKMNVTDTASAAASLLMQFQVGGSDKFKVGKDGSITSAANLTLAGNATITGNVTISGTLSAAGITGTVTGPGAATDNAIARFNGTTGGVIQNSGVIISDTNAITGVVGLTSSGDITAASADVIASNFLVGGSGIYSKTAAGTLFFRPNGKASATGQMSIATNGDVAIAGAMAATGGVSGTTGTFSGAISGTTGAFSGDVTVSGADVIASDFIVGLSGIYSRSSSGTMLFRPVGKASATGQMSLTNAGNLTVAGDVTASSDRRLKKSISAIDREWAGRTVRELEPKTFLRKNDDTRGIGFIAQDVQAYAPDLVHEGPDGMLSLAYPNMVAILWEAARELQDKVAVLEAR